MADIKTVYWYNQLQVINSNFEKLNEDIASSVQPSEAIAGLSEGNLPAVPETFADEAAIQTYLESLVASAESRIDALDSKVNEIILKLRASGAISE